MNISVQLTFLKYRVDGSRIVSMKAIKQVEGAKVLIQGR
jgi:hypothetical protein